MDRALRKLLLTPLPPEQRVVSQIIRPLYYSKSLNALFNGKFVVCKEIDGREGKPKWELWSALDIRGPAPQSPLRLVTALPRSDPLRPVPKRCLEESVWTLMAYLYAHGPLDAPIAAMLPFRINKVLYIGFWGVTEPVGYRLHLIRHKTPYQSLRAAVNGALLLVSESLK